MTQREKFVNILSKYDYCSSPFVCSPSCKYINEENCFPYRTADLLLHFGAIIPTFKVGDTIWINDYQYGVIECVVDKPYHYNYKDVIKRFFTEDDIGKTIFLTEEECKDEKT